MVFQLQKVLVPVLSGLDQIPTVGYISKTDQENPL